MKKNSLKSLIKSTQKWANDHAPGLMVGGGTTMLLVSVGVSAFATYRAVREYDKAKDEKGEEFRQVVDTAKIVAKHAALPVATSIGGAILIHEGFKEEAKALAAVTAVCALKSEKLDILEEKTKEILNKNKKQELDDAVAQEMTDRSNGGNIPHYINVDGESWFLDPVTQQYFRSTLAEVQEKFVEYTARLQANNFASYWELCDMLGEPRTENTRNLGYSCWEPGDILTFDYDSSLARINGSGSTVPIFVIRIGRHDGKDGWPKNNYDICAG